MHIEGYALEAVIGRDGPTTLYRARQLSLDRPVVIEVLDAAGSQDARDAFAEECRRLSGLLHPNLVSGLACGELDGRPWLVTEHVGGRTLETVVAEEGRLGEERSLRVGRQLARALAYLEASGLLHGEMSPATVLLSPEDVAKLDRIPAVREPGWKGRDRLGRPVGTPGYKGAEACGGQVPFLDHRLDVHALGGILYFLLSGVSPAEDAIGELVGGRMIDRPVALRARRGTLGKATLELVSRLMASDPDDRVPDATTAGELIDAALDEADQRTRLRRGRGRLRRARSQRPVVPRSPDREPRPRPRRRRRR